MDRLTLSHPHRPASTQLSEIKSHTRSETALQRLRASGLLRCGAPVLLACVSINVAAQSRSDLLIVLDSDGIGYTAQQTLFADDELLVTSLPAQRTTIDTVFAGTGSALYELAYKEEPDRLTLVSGSALTRFRHRFSEAPDGLATQNANLNSSQSAPQTTSQRDTSLSLQASLHEFDTTMATTSSLQYTVSWLLPDTLELLEYYPANSDAPDTDFNWQQSGPLLTYTQNGGTPITLRISYRIASNDIDHVADCLATIAPSEQCSPDADADKVPDYRDLCVDTDPGSALSVQATDQTPSDNTDGQSMVSQSLSPARADSLGCGNDQKLVLADVQFESGQTYLTAQSRTLLDKVAIALKRQSDSLYRIAAYTDNAGYFDKNQRLSKDRADAIRHYLMLRGVSPNQLQSRGYGEANPAHDNRSAAGRRANRRVELQRLN